MDEGCTDNPMSFFCAWRLAEINRYLSGAPCSSIKQSAWHMLLSLDQKHMPGTEPDCPIILSILADAR
jgi:hypothetical protein